MFSSGGQFVSELFSKTLQHVALLRFPENPSIIMIIEIILGFIVQQNTSNILLKATSTFRCFRARGSGSLRGH